MDSHIYKNTGEYEREEKEQQANLYVTNFSIINQKCAQCKKKLVTGWAVYDFINEFKY